MQRRSAVPGRVRLVVIEQAGLEDIDLVDPRGTSLTPLEILSCEVGAKRSHELSRCLAFDAARVGHSPVPHQNDDVNWTAVTGETRRPVTLLPVEPTP